MEYYEDIKLELEITLRELEEEDYEGFLERWKELRTLLQNMIDSLFEMLRRRAI